MSLTHRQGLPAMIEKGRDTAITIDVYDGSTQKTATVATLQLYSGSELVLDGVSATGLGPPATYTVLAAVTADRSVSADWLAVWSLTIGGVVHIFRQPIYLVNHLLHNMITDADLTDRHSDLDSLRDSANMTSFAPFITAAFDRVQRMLIKRGNRPALIIDAWAFTDLLTFETLAPLYRDFASSLGDSRYTELADHYAAAAASEWAGLTFRYDEGEDGTGISGAERRGTPVVFLNAPRRRRASWPR